MEIKIQVLSIAQEAKQSSKGTTYQQLEVAYKDLTNGGKVASKKIMDFSSKSVFQILVNSKAAEFFDIEMEKKGDYWNWISAKKGTMTATTVDSPSTKATASSATAKGGWETPEERARKQIYIVRQSSLGHAVTALTANVKANPKAEEIIELARQFEAFVFESDSVQATARKDVGSIETMDEDIPY